MKYRDLKTIIVFLLTIIVLGWFIQNWTIIFLFVALYGFHYYLFGVKNISNKARFGSEKTLSVDKGIQGEALVSKLLYDYSNKVKAILYNDIIIGEFERSTQIDHLLITNNAIYFVETKRYAGGVFGDDSKENWYQVIFKGSKKVKNSFLNPFIQNEHHIKRFKEYMGDTELPPLINIVCFVVNQEQTLDLSKIINRNKDYYLTDDKRLLTLITKIDNENKVSKTSTLALEQQSNHLIDVKNRIAEIVVTDEEERQNHIKRLMLREVEQLEDDKSV